MKLLVLICSIIFSLSAYAFPEKNEYYTGYEMSHKKVRFGTRYKHCLRHSLLVGCHISSNVAVEGSVYLSRPTKKDVNNQFNYKGYQVVLMGYIPTLTSRGFPLSIYGGAGVSHARLKNTHWNWVDRDTKFVPILKGGLDIPVDKFSFRVGGEFEAKEKKSVAIIAAIKYHF